MPPKKRARTAAASASSSSSPPAATAAPKLTLSGGVPHHSSLVALWRGDRLTDFAVCAEGVEFKAHRVALASCSGYFLNLFESGMRDAADATHALQGVSPPVLKVLLAFVYEGKCETDEGLLTEMLEASHKYAGGGPWPRNSAFGSRINDEAAGVDVLVFLPTTAEDAAPAEVWGGKQ